jgi:hypothetical protein
VANSRLNTNSRDVVKAVAGSLRAVTAFQDILIVLLTQLKRLISC